MKTSRAAYDGSNIRREKSQIDEKPLCTHKNQRGFTYASKHCPMCGAQLKYDAGEKPIDPPESEQAARLNRARLQARAHKAKGK